MYIVMQIFEIQTAVGGKPRKREDGRKQSRLLAFPLPRKKKSRLVAVQTSKRHLLRPLPAAATENLIRRPPPSPL